MTTDEKLETLLKGQFTLWKCFGFLLGFQIIEVAAVVALFVLRKP